jgi:hypothetical protein
VQALAFVKPSSYKISNKFKFKILNQDFKNEKLYHLYQAVLAGEAEKMAKLSITI